jgi:hypothetical protein
MSGLRRCTPAKHILELTRQLAEDYESVPLHEVSRVVRNAVAAAAPRTDVAVGRSAGPPLVAMIEQLARAELDRLKTGRVAPASAGPAHRAARRNAPRQGVA